MQAARFKRGSRALKPWVVESLEPRLMLSFSEVAVGDLFPGLTSAAPLWGDYNNDGWVDAVISGQLFQNNDGSSFTEVTSTGGAFWGDFNNDGWLDLHTNRGGCCPTFSINEGGTGEFSTFTVGNFGNTASLGSALGDFNSDGWLDVYIGGYESWPGVDFPDRLVLNVPDATKPGGRGFEVIDEVSYLRARSVAAADFNEDGHTDVYVSNYRLQGNLLWINNGSGSDFPFIFGSDSHGARGGDGHSIGGGFGDLDSDGHIDIFAGNFSHPGQPQTRILLNQGPAGDYHFSDLGQRGIYWKESWSSPALGDFDNDGMLDVFFTALNYYGNDSELFRNTGSPGNPQFADVTAAEGIPGGLDGYVVSWADWDNDGDLDLATNGRLFRNNLNNGNSWLKVDLSAPGIDGVNAFGFGATVRIDTGSKIVTRHVESGQGQGNQNDLTMHFGLGNTSGPVEVEVSWPGGMTRTIETELNRDIKIHYGSTPKKDFFTVAEDSVLSVGAVIGVMSNDFFLPGGPSITSELVEMPTHGQVVFNSDGSFLYTPDANFFGVDVFTYRLLGDPDATGIGRVTVDVTPTPDAPVTVDDFVTLREDELFATGVPEETVVPLGSVWSYSDAGVSLGTAWREPAFDDSSWSTGAGQLGYGDGDEQTLLGFANDDKFATTYFRTEFEATDVGQLNDLKLSILRDDAAAVFLNGTEVYRDETLPADAAYDFFLGIGNHVSGTDENEFIDVDIDVSRLVEGTNLLAVEVHQHVPSSSDMSFDLSLEANSGAVTLLAEGSEWLYRDDGSDQGVAWRETDYDDSNWPTGPAQLGYGDDDEVTLVNGGYGETFKIPTYYFRRTFELSDVDRISQLLINMVRDDGAAVYLNGIEIARDHLAHDATFTTFASSGISGVNESEPVTLSFSDIPNGMFVDGTNLLAVEVHQVSGNSSDVSFDLEMIVRRDVVVGVLSNDIEIDGEAMTAELLVPPQHGTVVMTSDGHYSYTPDEGYSGPDSFTYRNADVVGIELALLNLGASWRYLDNGSDQGTAWQQTVFDDSDWSEGVAQLGYGDGDEATKIGYGPDSSNKYATTYFRTDFEVTFLDQSDLTASLLRDDAAAVYLNGVEVYRDSNLDGAAAYNDYATSALIEDEATPIAFSIPSHLVVLGNNVLAVEIHQADGGSSDISFDFELQGFGAGTFGSDEGVVNITVEAVNDFPVAVDDQYSTGVSQTLVVSAGAGVLANDNDDENDPLTAVLVRPPSHGDLTLESDGSFTYTPDTDYEGDDTFVYRPLDRETVRVSQTFIDQGSSWHYLDDGTDQGTAWREPSYNHFPWSLGPAELGFGDEDEQTVISFGGDAGNVHPTSYFRYDFEVAIAECVESLSAWLLRDDGAAVYLNGTEIFRDAGLPNDAQFDTLVDPPAGENATETFSPNPSLLVDGTNVIAVEVHQATPDSSDLSFDFSLTGQVVMSDLATVTIDISSASTLPGDVNMDGMVDAKDIDDLFAAVNSDSSESRFDVDQSGSVAVADVDYLITSIFNTTRGDTDLDRDVDTRDLTKAIIGFTSAGGSGKRWADGDTDGDGDIDTRDLTAAIIRFTGAGSNGRRWADGDTDRDIDMGDLTTTIIRFSGVGS